jgi:hypothetical protein
MKENLVKIIKYSIVSSLVTGALLSPDSGYSLKTCIDVVKYALPCMILFIPVFYSFTLVKK